MLIYLLFLIFFYLLCSLRNQHFHRECGKHRMFSSIYYILCYEKIKLCNSNLYSSCFCKSSMSCTINVDRVVVELLAYPIQLPQAFPVVTDCMFEPIVQLRLYYVMPCQPLARYYEIALSI